ncbi:MAG: AI-2E family transporter [Ilumatobacteraceae bacterium]
MAIRQWGTSAWMLVGVVVFASLVVGALGAVSGVVVPLTIAALIGIIASPLVDYMNRFAVPRLFGALFVMLGLIVILVGSIAISVRGVIDQSDEISQQVTAGVAAIDDWLDDHNIDVGTPSDQVDGLSDAGRSWVGGLASYASTIFSGLLAFLVGGFLALFFTFYVLSDWHRLRDWVGSHLGVPPDLGSAIVDDVTGLIRRGFYALSLSSLVTAILIGAAMLILDVPLAFTVAIVTFVTSYIPYLGAILSGAFGFLVALGSSGISDAIILLVVILVVQNIVQTIVGNRLTSTTLALHPIANLISTIVGAALAGLLGAMLSAPLLAAVIAVHRRVRDYEPSLPGAAAAPADAGT